MRIAFVTPEYATAGTPDGGLANYLRVTAKGLRERGHGVTIIVASDADRCWADGDVQVCEAGVDSGAFGRFVRAAPGLRALYPGIAQYAACQKLSRAFWRLHDKAPFDIVQASSFQAPGYFLLRNGRVPVVTRASSYSPWLRTAYGRSTTVADRISDALELRQVTRAEACFAPSQFVAGAYALAARVAPKVIRTCVRIGDEPQDMSFFSAHRPQTRRYLLFFGTLSRIKGVDLIAEFIEPLLLDHQDLAFLFIGRDDGLPDGRKCIDVIHSGAGVARSRVIHFPALPKPQLLPFVANATAVVMPSRADNYPNACLEAQALGVPVIGTLQSSLDEMIVDGRTGFLAQNGDAGSLRASIERCLSMSDSARAAMRDAALEASRRAQSDDPIQSLIRLYEDTREAYSRKGGV